MLSVGLEMAMLLDIQNLFWCSTHASWPAGEGLGLLCGRHIIIYSGTFILLYHNAASASLDGLLP